MNATAFTYLITIHNKERLLPAVLEGVAACAGAGATLVPVLDGCSDGSAALVAEFARHSRIRMMPVVTPDVHEIRAINAGLAACGPGYCVVLQDDVVLRESQLETRVRNLDTAHGGRLGCLSLRMGGTIVTDSVAARFRRWRKHPGRWPRSLLDVTGLTGSSFDTHPVPKAQTLAPGEFVAVSAAFKSPIVLTPALRASEPCLDEALAPHSFDDLDLSIRALRRGLINGVCALAYASEPEWGGTRHSDEFRRTMIQIMRRNQTYLWRKHGAWLRGPGRAHLEFR